MEKRASTRPQLSDLRESGDIEADADVVMFLHQPEQAPAGQDYQPTEIFVAKHRNGPIGSVPTMFRKSTTRFENAAIEKVDLNA